MAGSTCQEARDTVAYPLRVGSLREVAHLLMPNELDTDMRSCAGLPHAWITNLEDGNTTRMRLFGELHASEPDRFHMAMSME